MTTINDLIYNIVNQVVKCDCKTSKHDPADYECACADCLDEWVERLNEMLIRKAVLDDRQRTIKLLEAEIARHYELELEASAHYLEGLVALIKGEQK